MSFVYNTLIWPFKTDPNNLPTMMVITDQWNVWLVSQMFDQRTSLAETCAQQPSLQALFCPNNKQQKTCRTRDALSRNASIATACIIIIIISTSVDIVSVKSCSSKIYC